jgi:hypothetical protein
MLNKPSIVLLVPHQSPGPFCSITLPPYAAQEEHQQGDAGKAVTPCWCPCAFKSLIVGACVISCAREASTITITRPCSWVQVRHRAHERYLHLEDGP